MVQRSPNSSMCVVPGGGPSGITLIEILVVLAMVGILAAVTIPRVATSTAPYAVIEGARRVHSALVEARTRAIAEQRDYRLSFAPGEFEIQYWLSGTGWTTLGVARELPESMTATIDGSTSGAVVFLPHGRVDAPTSIVVEDESHEHTIQVLASGLVRWEGRRQ